MQRLQERAEGAERVLAVRKEDEDKSAYVLRCTEARLLAAIETIRQLQDQACVQVCVKKEVSSEGGRESRRENDR